MKVLTVMHLEWRRIWRNKLTRAGLAAGLVLPLLYSSLYLWANWDPYGSLSKLPVAVVNEDSGGTSNGKHVNYGREIVSNLIKDNSLGWKVASNQAAIAGLNGNQYYMVLRVPATFTTDILSVNTAHPHQAHLDFVPNQGKNYLAGQIVKRVQGDVAAHLNQEFSQRFFSQLLAVVGKEQNGLSTISINAKKLSQGATSVNNGAVSLHHGLVSLSSGANQMTNALSQLAPDAAQLQSGIGQTRAGTERARTGVLRAGDALGQIRTQASSLPQSADQLSKGVTKAVGAADQLHTANQRLSDGTSRAVSGAASLASGIGSSLTGARQIQGGLSQVESLLSSYQQATGATADPRIAQAYEILKQLSPGANALTGGLEQSQAGATNLANSLSQIAASQKQVSDGLGSLHTQLGTAARGASTLGTGITQMDHALSRVQSGLSSAATGLGNLTTTQTALYNGATQLHSGIVQTQTGSRSLANGIGNASLGSAHLVDGTNQLAQGANAFSNQMTQATHFGKVANPSILSHIMAQPVSQHTTVINPVSKYGPGLAPYFIPLSLWVGALMLYFLMGLKEGRWRIAPISSTTVLLGKFALLWVIGVAQAIVASTVLLLALHLHVGSVVGFYAYNMVLSMTYITIIGMFIALLGSGPGRFISIALLLLQLTSSAGTFPVELVPGFFQFLHPLLPMSHAVVGLRSLISMNDFGAAWNTAGVTLCYLVGAFIMLVLFTRRKLRPEDLRTPDQLVS